MTENQRIYKKEIARLNKIIKRDEKLGIIYPEDILPKTPKRITKKAIQDIKNITPRKLRLKAVKLDVETGEITPANEYYTQRRKESAKKSAKTRRDKKISNYRSTLPQEKRAETYEPLPTVDIIELIRDRLNAIERKVEFPQIPVEVRKSTLISNFEDTVTYLEMNDNLDQYRQHLSANESEIEQGITIIEYDSDTASISASFVRLMQIINYQPLTSDQLELISAYTESYGYEEI